MKWLIFRWDVFHSYKLFKWKFLHSWGLEWNDAHVPVRTVCTVLASWLVLHLGGHWLLATG